MLKTAAVTRLEADLASVLLEVKPLAQKSATAELTTDEDSRFTELTARINTVKEALDSAVQQAEAIASVLEYDQHYNQPADVIKRGLSLDTATEPGTGGGNARKSLGQKFIDSAQYKSRNARGVMTDQVKFNEPDDIKALIYSGTASASTLLPQVLPNIYRAREAPLVLRDVLLNMSTDSDNVTVLQENVFTNAAVEVAEATLVSEGAKPESAITFTEATFPVRTIAHWIPITRQMLEDLAMMRSYVDDRLLTGLRRREDNQFLNGNGTPPNLTGILQTAGIQALTSAGEFTTSPVKDAATTNENLNRLRRGIRKIKWTAFAEPSFFVVNPVDAEDLDTISDANRNYLIGGPLLPAQRRIWGLPVVESANIAAKTALVGDGSMAAVVDRNQAAIYTTDSHSDFFIRNLFVILAEERVALAVFRPSAFASVQLV